MRKKGNLPNQRIAAAIRMCKGHCKHISEKLHIDYHKALALKKDPLYRPIFEKVGIVKGGMPKDKQGYSTFNALGMERIIQTILDCGGIASKVSKKLKVGYSTVWAWKDRPEIAAAFQLAVEKNLDLGEDTLIKNMKSRDNVATIFYMKCKGAKRGYIETQRNVNITQDEYEKLNDNELESKLAALQRSIEAAENRTTEITE
jgi:hypothetical protein